jgi:hypothetical protein
LLERLACDHGDEIEVRHACVTMLAERGVYERVAQQLAATPTHV